MTKNNASAKSATKSAAKKTARVSKRGHVHFAFAKVAKDLPKGIMSVVYEAAKKAKRGSVADIAALAVKSFGLKKATDQDPLVQTHVMLNRLRVRKIVRRIAA